MITGLGPIRIAGARRVERGKKDSQFELNLADVWDRVEE